MITNAQISQVITATLAREGGYVDNPADHGGATNFGITQTTADDLGLGNVRDLNYARAASAYQRLFASWHIDQMPEFHTFALVADCCVNHGAGHGVRWLQQALGIVDDGIIGPQTLQALDANAAMPRGSEALYAAVLGIRIAFYGSILGNNHSQVVFAHGWLNRCASFLRPWPYA